MISPTVTTRHSESWISFFVRRFSGCVFINSSLPWLQMPFSFYPKELGLGVFLFPVGGMLLLLLLLRNLWWPLSRKVDMLKPQISRPKMQSPQRISSKALFFSFLVAWNVHKTLLPLGGSFSSLCYNGEKEKSWLKLLYFRIFMKYDSIGSCPEDSRKAKVDEYWLLGGIVWCSGTGDGPSWSC